MSKVLYWFRTDLRLHDSPALKAALDLNPVTLIPLFSFDPSYVYAKIVGPNRWQFLLDSLVDTSKRITAINPKSKLHVIRGPPKTVIAALFKTCGITDLVFEKDDDAYSVARDAEIIAIAKEHGVKVHSVLGHTLFDSSVALAKNKNVAPPAYGSFLKLVPSLPKPALPILAPTSLPDPGPIDTSTWDRSHHSVEAYRAMDINFVSRLTGTTERDQTYDSFAGPNNDFSPPTMEELGMVATGSIRGGETQALIVFEAFMAQKNRVATFEKPKTSPAAFDPPSTTQLSPHMKFGTISPRTFYHRVMEINKAHKSPTAPPESLIGQLMWREFFHLHQFATPHFGEIRGNKLSRYIDWDLQTQYDASGKRLSAEENEKAWKTNEPEAHEKFLAWQEGRTGFPWIDALMRQLIAEGWMHHLGRHSVACFLTRGQLYISWERGAETFAKHLVDHDAAVNEANWMWLSASAFFHQYYRVYSPATFGQKSDKTGALIRKYCPELAKFPDKFIYEPWTASAAIQKTAGCIIGVDYPARIVEHRAAEKTAMAGMKASYAATLKGNNPKVLANTAAAYVQTFRSISSAAAAPVKEEDDDEVDDEPKAKKRKAPAAKVDKTDKAKKIKQSTLAFA